MFASLKKKCLGSYQWSTINFLKSKKKKKKKKKREFDYPRLFATNAPGCTAKW